jgi:choline kinase
VITFPRDNVVLLSGPTSAGDEVYADAEDEHLVALSKDRSALRHVVGELVGISKISRDLFQAMLAAASHAFEQSLKVAYETDTLVTVAHTRPVYYTLLRDLCWGEIDDEEHLARAREQVYPRLIEACWKGRILE